MYPFPRITRLFPVLIIIILALVCGAGVSGASSGTAPVINAISGPTSFENPYSLNGTYTYAVVVSGGTPPYTYKWFTSPSKVIFEGPGYATVQIPGIELLNIGPGTYWIEVSVTDANGQQASWNRTNGLGATPVFSYGLVFEEISSKWTVITNPATFPANVSGEPVNQTATTAPGGRVEIPVSLSGTPQAGMEGLTVVGLIAIAFCIAGILTKKL